jgi:hypothetical protein
MGVLWWGSLWDAGLDMRWQEFNWLRSATADNIFHLIEWTHSVHLGLLAAIVVIVVIWMSHLHISWGNITQVLTVLFCHEDGRFINVEMRIWVIDIWVKVRTVGLVLHQNLVMVKESIVLNVWTVEGLGFVSWHIVGHLILSNLILHILWLIHGCAILHLLLVLWISSLLNFILFLFVLLSNLFQNILFLLVIISRIALGCSHTEVVEI